MSPDTPLREPPAEAIAATPSRGSYIAGQVLTALLAAVCYLILMSRGLEHLDYFPRRYRTFHIWLVIAGYAALLVTALIPRLRRYIGSMGLGIAIASPAAMGSFLGLLEFVFLLFYPAPSEGFIAAWGFLLSNVGLAVTSSVGRGEGQKYSVGAGILMAVYMIGVAPATEGLKSYEADQLQRARAFEKAAAPALYRAQSCLLRFKATRGGSYPQSMKEVEDVMPGCLPTGMAAGSVVEGYRYVYQPAASNTIQQFKIIAEPAIRVGRVWTSLVSDESAIVRISTEDLQKSGQERPLTPAGNLANLVGCITNHAALNEGLFFAPVGKERTANANELPYPDSADDIRATNRCPDIQPSSEPNAWSNGAYRFTYRKEAEPPEKFTLTARPLEYGRTGIRSYFADNTGIRATVEDRGATLNDGDAIPCELSTDGFCYTPVVRDLRSLPKKIFPEGALHPGGLASGAEPQVFWQGKGTGPRFIGSSADLQEIYVVTDGTLLAAIRPDSTPIWGYVWANRELAAGDSLYVLGDGVLTKLRTGGTRVWSFGSLENKDFTRSSRGVVYALGTYLHAIDDDGKQVWRMYLAERGSDYPTLSVDEKTLYVAGPLHLFAIDAEKGRLLWSAENPCQTAPFCVPEPLADGSVAVGWSSAPAKWGVRILDRNGKQVWSRDYENFVSYLSPKQTNSLVVVTGRGFEAVDSLGRPLWKNEKAGSDWWTVRHSSHPGLFYACTELGLAIFDHRGALRYQVPGNTCGITYEAAEHLVFIQNERGLWTARIPEDGIFGR
jgi:PQQ-like domain